MSLSDEILQGEIDNRTGKYLHKYIYIKNVKEFIKKMLELLRGYSFNSPEMFSIIDKFKEEAGDKLI